MTNENIRPHTPRLHQPEQRHLHRGDEGEPAPVADTVDGTGKVVEKAARGDVGGAVEQTTDTVGTLLGGS